MANQLLLIEDVDDLGRSGEIVRVKPGYARNFLLPQKKAVVATKYTLRMQAKLQEERAKTAEIDRKLSEETSKKLEGITLAIEVKVDPDGHMYGSVSALDIVRLLQEEEGITIERRNVDLPQPIKELGVHRVHLKLKEGIPAEIVLKIMTQEQMLRSYEESPQEATEENY